MLDLKWGQVYGCKDMLEDKVNFYCQRNNMLDDDFGNLGFQKYLLVYVFMYFLRFFKVIYRDICIMI